MTARHEAKWVDSEGKTKRRFSWGWAWLLVIPAALIFFSVYRYNDYQQWADFTVTTVVCDAPVDPTATWAEFEAAGCAPRAADAQVMLLNNNSAPADPPENDGVTWQFPTVASASPALALDVKVPTPVEAVVIADANSTPPAPISSMNHDTSRMHFTDHLQQGDSVDFYVIIVPAK